MDEHRFDEYTKALASGSTRRGALRAMAGGLVIAVLGKAGVRSAVAKPAQRGSKCAPPDDRCDGQRPCCGNLACVDGVCCPPGRQCGWVCCPGGTTCSNGQCISEDVCRTHADCDDGNACTVDLCGPVSHQCFNIPISDDCVQCTSDADCSGGSCCHGRCCPAGAGCQLSATGEPVCCPDCDPGGTCCDQISYSCNSESCSYYIAPARCFFGAGTCSGCAGCSTANCKFVDVEDVPGVVGTCIGATGTVCGADCVAPVGAIA